MLRHCHSPYMAVADINGYPPMIVSALQVRVPMIRITTMIINHATIRLSIYIPFPHGNPMGVLYPNIC